MKNRIHVGGSVWRLNKIDDIFFHDYNIKILKMDLPIELQSYILDFVRPYVTRSDWKTCRLSESYGIKKLARLFIQPEQVLENGSWKIEKMNPIFYERLLYGRVVKKEERNTLFPRKHLNITIWSIA